MYETLGTHYLLDCWGVDSKLLSDISYLNEVLTTAIHKTGATILDIAEYKFKPGEGETEGGCTMVFLLSESHCSIHSYESAMYCGIDLYTCGSHVDTEAGVRFILDELKPTDFNIKKIIRGARE